MRDEVVIGGELILENNIDGDCNLENLVDGETGIFTVLRPATYEGETTVIPNTQQQVLQTAGLMMENNVTVEAVPAGSATTPKTMITVKPDVRVDERGLVRVGVSGNESITPEVVPGYVDRGTAGNVEVDGSAELQLDIEAGKTVTPGISQQTAVAVGKFTTGNILVGPITLKDILLRPDAELVRSWSLDSLVVDDESKTIPGYSTSAQTVIAAENLSPQITLDYANYKYYVVERFLTIPIYNTSIKEKGRPDSCMTSYLCEIVELEQNVLRSVDGSPAYASRSVAIAGQTVTRAPYWSAASTMGIYTATTYTVGQVVSAPTVSSGKLTVIAPSLQMRGSTTYFTSSAWGKITDIRRQYVIEVWRVPKEDLNVEGWGSYQNALKIANCINGTTNKLV